MAYMELLTMTYGSVLVEVPLFVVLKGNQEENYFLFFLEGGGKDTPNML